MCKHIHITYILTHTYTQRMHTNKNPEQMHASVTQCKPGNRNPVKG